MSDILIAIGVIAAISALLFTASLQFARRAPTWASNLVAIGTFVALVLYIRFLWDDVLLARLLPFSSLIVLGNWFSFAAAIVGGVAWQRVPGGKLRKSLYVVGFAGVATYAVARPFLGSTPQCENLWDGDICLQTTDDTCSAACAATLLKAAGIEATEQELAQLCFTRDGGTTWQGLYRGMMLKTAGTPWTVEVFSGDFDALRTRPGPLILAVGLPENVPVDPVYTEQYGWLPGEWHSVLLFRFLPDDRVEMAEPTPGVGREQWTVDDLRVLWRGRGLRLVRR